MDKNWRISKAEFERDLKTISTISTDWTERSMDPNLTMRDCMRYLMLTEWSIKYSRQAEPDMYICLPYAISYMKDICIEFLEDCMYVMCSDLWIPGLWDDSITKLVCGRFGYKTLSKNDDITSSYSKNIGPYIETHMDKIPLEFREEYIRRLEESKECRLKAIQKDYANMKDAYSSLKKFISKGNLPLNKDDEFYDDMSRLGSTVGAMARRIRKNSKNRNVPYLIVRDRMPWSDIIERLVTQGDISATWVNEYKYLKGQG